MVGGTFAGEPKVMNSLIRVTIVEDNETDRMLVKRELDRSSLCRCVGDCASAVEALNEIPRLNPDVVLMDIRLPGMSGIECTRWLKTALPQLRIVMLTGLTDSHAITEALRAGSDNYLIKPFTANQLITSIRMACLVDSRLPQEREPILYDNRPASLRAKARSCPVLTGREPEIVEQMAEGLLDKEIADKLGLSEFVVHKHVHQILVKFGVCNRTQAASKWWDWHRGHQH
jgi:DNA-binding NarL/FixJ family response regulator